MDPHSIHVEQLGNNHDQPHYAYAYGPEHSPELDAEVDFKGLNRHSSSSTLIGGIPSPLDIDTNQEHTSFMSDLKIKTATAKKSNKGDSRKRGLWYRFTHSESGRLACAFIYFVVVCIGMAFCNQLSDNRWVETGYTKVLLRDRGFEMIEAQADIQPANTFVMTSVVLSVLGIGIICPSWTMRAVVLRRVLWVIGTLSAYRAMTLSVTTLPSPKEECRPSLKTDFWDMFLVALQMIPGTVEACTDDIFSGHTVFMVSCAIQWRLYCKNKWITYFSYLYISVGLYFVVATRLHYTVDVVLAVFITFALWSLYISMVDVVMEQEYFGITSHHEKYAAFDSVTTEYELIHGKDNENNRCTGNSTLRMRRRQLEHHLNRLRGPRIGYGRGEYDRVAFLPMQFNLWLKGLIRWCDGLDLRMRPEESADEGVSRWEELVVRHRSKRVSSRNCTCSTKIHRKMDEGLGEDMEDMEEEEEMVKVYRRDCMILESIRVDGHSNGIGGQQQRGLWRSLPLRSSSERNRDSSVKEKRSGKTDHGRKWLILKIVAIILVNAILLAKVAQVIQNRTASPDTIHWPTDMESYPGGTIYGDEASPQYQEPQGHSNSEEHGDEERGRRGEQGNGQSHEDETGEEMKGEKKKGERIHNRTSPHGHRESGHHRNRSRKRDLYPEGAI